ncbi:hypothetical protein [Sinorhizobium americanum]|nr:hypothetical protein [Sinorhizobium americanum]
MKEFRGTSLMPPTEQMKLVDRVGIGDGFRLVKSPRDKAPIVLGKACGINDSLRKLRSSRAAHDSSFKWRSVPMPKPNPQEPERLHVKLLFGLFEGNATGPAVKYVAMLAVFALIGRGVGLW